ncbi:Caffeine dehydrogenase subunit alpha [archaeon HR01]|nr:Caffeine dehydrogenase subunit alpha [archaeon HR01]
MASRYVGTGLKILDGARFVTGSSKYVDDIKPYNTLYGVFVRSRYAHAKVLGIETREALSISEAVAVFTGAESKMAPIPKMGMSGLKEPDVYPLAVGKTRYVGEPIALCVARDLYAAYDMAERVRISYEPLKPVLSPEEASTSEILLYEELGGNTALRLEFKGGNIEQAFMEADKVIRRKIRIHRTTAASLEPRGTVAQYDRATASLTVWSSTQFPHILRTHISRYFNIPESKVRVIACDIGGGFGVKAHIFREDLALCHASIELGQTIKWFETRSEFHQSSIHEREQVHDIEIAFKKDGTVLAVKDRCYADLGAYGAPPWGGGALSMFTSVLLPGPYKLKAYVSEHIAAYTNKGPYGAVRGPALLQANYVMERVMDAVARELGLSPAEVRLRNLIKKTDQPYTTLGGQVFNSASFEETLQRLLQIIDYQRLREEQKRLRREGVYMGIGFSILAEYGAFGSAVNSMFGMGGYDSVKVVVEPSGAVTVYTGLVNIGQGITTAIAQTVADRLQIPIEKISVISGDTSSTPYGIGSHSSRGGIIGGNAAAIASERIIQKMKQVAGTLLEADPRDIEFTRGRFHVRDDPSKGIGFMDVVQTAYVNAHKLPAGLEPVLEATSYYEPTSPITWANAAHASIVRVDPETGQVKVEKYYVVEDCGNVINSAVVEGQVVGGVVMGISHILYEDLVYDSAGNLLTSSFSDYLVASPAEAPDIEVELYPTQASDNPGGYKGVGEGGTIASLAAVANAVDDALREFGCVIEDAPLTPAYIRSIISRT